MNLLRRFAIAPLVVVSLLAGSFPNPAYASTLVLFPLNNSADGQSGLSHPTFNSTVLASSSVTKGSGLGFFGVGTDSWSGTTQVLKNGPGSTIANATSADAVTNGWYFNINLTPNTTMDIASIEADWSRGGTSGVRGWFIRSSQDNFATDLYSNETPAGTATGLQHVSVNLSGFTGVGATDFRFYIYTPADLRYMDFQNIQFNAPAVPEPSTYAIALVGLACGGASMWRRRRKAREGTSSVPDARVSRYAIPSTSRIEYSPAGLPTRNAAAASAPWA